MSFMRAPGLGRGSISALVRYAANHSLTLAQCLEGTKIKHDFETHTEDPNPEQEVILIENLIRHFGKPFLTGFSVGMNYRLDELGVLGLALMSSRNASHAVEIGERYLNLAFNLTQFSLVKSDDKLTLQWQFVNHYPEAVQQFLIARDIGLIHFIDRHINVNAEARTFHKMGFTFDFLTGMEEMSKEFGCPVKYNETSTYLISDIKHLLAPPPFSNPANATIIEETYFKRLEKKEVSLRKRIRLQLLTEPHLNLKKVDIARVFNMSERTLARHLNKEDISWRQLLSEVRIEKAEQLLKHTREPIQRICDQVGFANLSSFSHAFQKRNQLSPSEYRRMNANNACKAQSAETPLK